MSVRGRASSRLRPHLTNRLPAPRVHGREIRYVDGSFKAIREAFQQIRENVEYRRHLEPGARECSVT